MNEKFDSIKDALDCLAKECCENPYPWYSYFKLEAMKAGLDHEKENEAYICIRNFFIASGYVYVGFILDVINQVHGVHNGWHCTSDYGFVDLTMHNVSLGFEDLTRGE